MSTIRSTRLRKIRKKHKKFMVTCNAAFIWYLLMFTLINLSSNTNAIFISQAKNTSTFHAKASWGWDRSSLAFTDSYGGDCNEIYALVKNEGTGDMAIPSKFYVYYNPTKNPVNPQGINGDLVYKDGIIPKLSSKGQPIKLTYKPQKPGVYKFVAFQHPQKPGSIGGNLTIEGTLVTFSESITLKQCTNQ